MKRKRRFPASKKPSELNVENDVATGVTAYPVRPPENRYSTMRLPHERDESTHRPGEPNEVTEQAAKDTEQGKV